MKQISYSFCYQVLSRPLLVLSIATVFTEQTQSSDGTPERITDSHDSEEPAEPSPVQDNLNPRYSGIYNLRLHAKVYLCNFDLLCSDYNL